MNLGNKYKNLGEKRNYLVLQYKEEISKCVDIPFTCKGIYNEQPEHWKEIFASLIESFRSDKKSKSYAFAIIILKFLLLIESEKERISFY